MQREERRCQSWRCVSLGRWTFPTDAAAGSIPHKRPPRRSSAVHLDQAIRPTLRASQSLTNAADAQQKIAFRLQVAIIVDRQCDGFVDRSELAREVRDRRIGQGLSLRVDNAAVLAILPFRQARDDESRPGAASLCPFVMSVRNQVSGVAEFPLSEIIAKH